MRHPSTEQYNIPIYPPTSPSRPAKNKNSLENLAGDLINALPLRPLRPLQAIRLNQRRAIQLPAPRNQIHIPRAHERRAEVNLIRDVESDYYREGQVIEEESLHAGTRAERTVADLPSRGPELGDEHEYVEDEAEPRAVDADLRFEGQLVERVALQAPGAAEADVCQADGAPGEDGGESGEGVQPVEGGVGGGLAAADDEAEEAEDGREGDGDEGAAAAVDVRKDAGRLALLCERGEGAGGAVDGGVADG